MPKASVLICFTMSDWNQCLFLDRRSMFACVHSLGHVMGNRKRIDSPDRHEYSVTSKVAKVTLTIWHKRLMWQHHAFPCQHF